MTPMQRRWAATVILGAAGGIDLLALNLLAAPAWIRESQASVAPTISAATTAAPLSPAAIAPTRSSAAIAPAAISAPVAATGPALPDTSTVPPSEPPSPTGRVVQEEPRFAVYSAVLDPRAHAILLAASERILAVPEQMVLLRGHSDQRGDDANNDQLSIQRANAAREFLVSAGIPRARIAVEGAGARHPIDPADTPDARARNRRVEILWRQ